MQGIEPMRTHLNAVDASGGTVNGSYFATNHTDTIEYSVEGTTPTVKLQKNAVWDSAANAPKSTTWYDVATRAAAGAYSDQPFAPYCRFVATAGNPVTVKARRMVADNANV
ncbi:MAG: hypothetical protein U0Y68_20735 [Blastocatellia bacterium]